MQESELIAAALQGERTAERALFWLAQRDDPRVLALFEEILLAH